MLNVINTPTRRLSELLSRAGFCLAACVFATLSAGAGVAVDETNFPDPNFLHFVKWVLYQQNSELGGTNPYSDDHFFDDEELAKIKTLNIQGRDAKVSDLTGIEHFTSLTSLNITGHEITTLDLSHNTNLVTAYLTDNKIESLNIQGCSQLKTLCVMGNNLSRSEFWTIIEQLPIVRGDYKFRVYKTDARTGYVDGNGITTLQAKRASAKGWDVRRLDIRADGYEGWNAFTGNKVAVNSTNFPDENFRQFIKERLYGENKTQYFDPAISVGQYEMPDGYTGTNPFYGATYLTDDDFYYVHRIPLDLWNEETRGKSDRIINDLTGIKYFTGAWELNCNGHSLTSLDVSGMKNLRLLRCQESNDMMTSLNVTGCESLYLLFCHGNQLTNLDVSTLVNLQHLDFGNTPIESIDLSNCPKLYYLEASNSNLSALDVTNNPLLQVLFCYTDRDNEADGPNQAKRGKIDHLDLSKNTELLQLRCSNNPLYDLDLSNNSKLQLLYCNNIDFKNGKLQENLYKLPELQKLSCYKDTLQSLDVSRNLKLTELVLWGNNVKQIDLRNNTALKTLVTGDNQVGVDARNVPLPNGGNPMTSLDVSALVNLETLKCAKGNLTDLNLTGLKKLKELNYAEQTRNVQAEMVKIQRKVNGEIIEEPLYYLRMDKNTTDKGGHTLNSRLAATANDRVSHFDVSLVDRTSWTSGDIVNGTRGSNGAPRRAAATVDNVNASQVIGDILVLKDITEDGDNASGTVTYKYNVKLDEEAIAVDDQSPFTLNWTASTSVVTSVNDIKASADVTGVTYYNLQGVASSEPFAGFNIVVTTHADGSQTAVKVVR